MAAITSDASSAGSTNKVAGSAVIVMAGYSLAIVLGIARGQVLSRVFGTSPEYDAFVAANTIPELLFNMLSGGALAFAFIPIYADILKTGSSQNANRLFSSVFNSVLILASIAALISALAAPFLIERVVPGYSPEQKVLTVQLMRVLLLTTVVFAVSSLLMGSLQAHTHFLLPAIAPSLYTLGVIVGALALAPRLGVFGLAWGAVIGSALHFLVQVPAIIKHGIRWQPILALKSSELHKVAVLMLPRVIDLLMAQATLQLLNNNLASEMGEGRVSALQYGYSLMNMPWTLIGVAIGTAVFPTMALLAADKDVSAQRQALSGSLRAVLALAIPAATGLIVLGRPIIQILYEGGEFTPESTNLVYSALRFWALMMISQSMLNVVVPAYAAQKDTWTPLYVSLFTTTLNIGLAYLLTRPFVGLAHAGLPLARAIAIGTEVVLDLAILARRWNGVDARRILLDAGKALVAAVAMGGAVLAVGVLLQPSPLLMLAIGGAVGALVYFAIALLLGIQEVRTIPLSLIRGLLNRRAQASTG